MTMIKLRRGLSTAFSTNNPVLAAGEPAFATDTGILKIGDGTTAYNSLPSIGASPDLSNYVQKTDYASTSAAGVVKVDGSTVTIDANGVISASGGGGASIDDTQTSSTTTYSSQKITNTFVASPDIRNMVKLTQAEYDALATKDANTFYVIIPS